MRERVLCSALLRGLLIAPPAQAQTTGQISGIVTSNAGQPVAGVQVLVRGTRLGAMTATTGRYTILAVPAGTHVVTTASIAHVPQEKTVTVTAGVTTTADFQLERRTTVLGDVLIVDVGYGTQERANITGAVATVDTSQFVAGPARDAASLIAGKIPGLAVVTPSGNPTAGSQIILRGRTTLQGSASPLILVDGVPGSLETVAPQDIQ